ncbi:MAG TPA: hypothetical protein VF179_22430 [Thermoanaerobaculia bacterium]|nr:hypothetical protein [Thermoanaerobaculia bacterium]
MNRRLLAAALAILSLGCLLQAAWGYSHSDLSGHAAGSDDAYISYRYALNLIAGHGLVFNPGERVEGYTNLLYVLLMAPLAWLAGPERLYPLSVALNFGFAALAVIQVGSFISRRLDGFRGGLAVVLLALCPSIWVAVASGLETSLVLCLQVGIWISVEEAAEGRKNRLLLVAGLSVLLILTRADGFLMPGLAAVFLFLKGRRRAGLAIAATAAATVAGLVLWRLSYYGWPLPNTYYAKVSGTPGARIDVALEQLSLIVSTTGLLLHVFALLLLVLELARRRSSALSFPVLFFLPWVGYWIYVGGDVFYERFLLILFPMGLFAILSLVKEARPRALARLAVAVCAVQLIQIPTDPRFAYLPDHYDRWVLLGRHIGEHHPGAVLASDAVGKVPYFSGLRTIDMLGLTDVHIAHRPPNPGRAVPGHSKTDPGYVISRRPDLIATWISYSLDMEWGLVRDVYEPAGYRIRYLVNAGRDPMEPNLIDAAGLSDEEISRKVGLGYGYGVLELRTRDTTEEPGAFEGETNG